MRAIFNVRMLIAIVFLLNVGCKNTPHINENIAWRLINPDTLSIDNVFWMDYYNEDAVGPKFWQLEFADTALVEHRSHGFNVLHKRNINFKIYTDTLILFYPRDYQFDHFNNRGEYLRLHTEKWLMQEKNDTLTLKLASVIDAYSNREHFINRSIVYEFVKPPDANLFPDYLMHAPKNKEDIIKIMNKLYSETGKAQLIEHFDSIPDDDGSSSFGNMRAMILSDLNNLFVIQNNPDLQKLFNHYHPEVIASKAIFVYLDYLEHKECVNVEKQGRVY